jgi:putative flavoprotein involved in K+ transport
LAKRLAYGDASFSVFLDMVDAHVKRVGLDASEDPSARDTLPDPLCLVEPIRHLDLRAAGVSTVVWATGYDFDFSWIDLPVLNKDRKPMHCQGLTEVAGMYFLGLPWLTSLNSSLVSGVGEDAARLADHIARRADGRVR